MPNMKPQFATPIAADVDTAAERHHHDPEAILEVLREVQAEGGGLSREAIVDVARGLHVPASHAYGVASFYTLLSRVPHVGHTIRACDGPVCSRHGAGPVRAALDALASEYPEWRVLRTSCLGLCDRAPAALVDDEQCGPLEADRAAEIRSGWRGTPTDYSTPRAGEVRVMMAQAGQIDPDDIESALAHGAYRGLQTALARKPESLIEEIEKSGLAGRGGAGFPAGRKWRFVAQANRSPKYIVCNADESEPLIFKDRVLIDTNPQQILEGMALAGYACGAQTGYIYIRGEYEAQAQRLERAIAQAESRGWLGEHIQGSDFSFHVHVHRGAGAYICGEETALLSSLEGLRGEPRVRPPYPPTSGFRALPTLVNNVETYAAAPSIALNGAEWFRSVGTCVETQHAASLPATPGTKMYMVLGHVKNPGLFEAPFGLTLRQIIDEFGGGMRDGSTFHFALTGGAAGTIVPEALLDIPIDYASASKGVSLGAGAFLICDQSVTVTSILRELLHFFAAESCGKCTPCRVGTRRALDILTRMEAGGTQAGDVATLYELANVMQAASFCGLGQSVAIPLRSGLTQFAEEF
jgi:NADH:ubiquinone oxidoreductase subunit F (NADH-binding)/NADH:ubiquinone oxidoreductase subunit E